MYNIVFILADDLGAWALHCAGTPELCTPNIDRIAREGIRFTDFYCASPVCSPARASILTGRIPSAHGVHDWIRSGNVDAARYAAAGRENPYGGYADETEPIAYLEGMPAYTDMLREAGYTCALSGKWHLGDSVRPQHGFDSWYTIGKGGCFYYHPDIVENGEILYAVNISFEDQNGDSVEPLKDVRVELNVDGASWDENCKLVHFREDGSKEIVENAVFKDGKITFSSDAFSVYAVVGDEAVEDDSRATLNFYGKNPTEPIATVYVKKSDTASELEYIIFDPGVGSIDNLESGEFFHGWNISPVNTTDGAEYTVNTPVKTIEDVREFFADDSLVIHEGDVYNIYAMIFRAYKIQYKDEDNATIHTAVKINKTGEPVDYTIDQTYTPKDANANFEGWNVTLGSENISNASAAAPYPYGTNMTISGDVTFTVNAPLGAWLSFQGNGSGATYTPPQFIKSGEVTGNVLLIKRCYRFNSLVV